MAYNPPKDNYASGEVLRRIIAQRLVHGPSGTIYTEEEMVKSGMPAEDFRRYDPDGPVGSNKSGVMKALADMLDRSEETITAWASGRLSIPAGKLEPLASALKLSKTERFVLYTAALTPKMERLQDIFHFDSYHAHSFKELMNRTLDACAMTEAGEVVTWEAVQKKALEDQNPEHLLGFKRFEAGLYERAQGGGGNTLARRLRRIDRIHDGKVFGEAIAGLPFSPEQVGLLFAKGILPEGARLKEDVMSETTFLQPGGEGPAPKSKGMLLEVLRQSHCVSEEGQICAWSDLIGEAITARKPAMISSAVPLTMEELGSRFDPPITRQYIQAITAGRNSTREVPFPGRMVEEVCALFKLGKSDGETFRSAPDLAPRMTLSMRLEDERGPDGGGRTGGGGFTRGGGSRAA